MKFEKIFFGFLFMTFCLLTAEVIVKAQNLQVADQRELKPGQTIQREMTGSIIHQYKFELKKDEFFQVRVEQKGIDVALKLLDADGKTLATMDSPNSKEGPEILSSVAGKSGVYFLNVSGFDIKAEKGNYSIKRGVSRPATAIDKRRIQIEKVFVEGMTARDTEGQSDLAISKLEEALKGWQEVKDVYLENLTKQQIEEIKKAQIAPSFYQLEIGKDVERQIRVGKTDVYTIELKKGSVLKVEVEEKGADIVLSFVKGNTDNFFLRYDVGNGEDREGFTYIIEEDGIYGVFVHAQKTNEIGKYLIKSQSNESAAAADRTRIEAERLLAGNFVNDKQGDEERAREIIKNWENSLSLWKQLGDTYWEGFTAYAIANTYIKIKDKTKAAEFYERSLALFEKLKNERKQVELVSLLRDIYIELGDKTKAIETLKKEAVLWNSLKYPLSEASAYSKTAQMYETLNYSDAPEAVFAYSESVKNYEKALFIYQDLGESLSIISVSGALSSIHNLKGNYDEAIKYAEISLATEVKVPQGADEAQKKGLEKLANISKLMSKNGLGMAYSQKREWEKALGYFNEVLSSLENIQFNESPNIRYIARVSIGQIYFFRYKWEKAIAAFQQILFEARQKNNKTQTAQTLNLLAAVHHKINEYDKALKYYKEALEIVNSVKDKDAYIKKLENSLLNNIGMVYLDLGNMPEAIKSFNKALSNLKDINDSYIAEDIATTYNNLANYYKATGNFQKAFESLNQALEFFRKSPAAIRNLARNQTIEATMLSSVATIYGALGNSQEELNYHKQSLELANKTDDKEIKATVLKSIGIYYAESGDMKTAKKYVEQALILFQNIGNKHEEALTLAGMGHIYDYSGDKEKAINYYDISINLTRKIKSKLAENQLLSNKAAVYGDLGENKIALDLFEEATKLARSIGDKEQEAYILNNAGAIYENLKDKKTALKNYQESALIFDRLGNKRVAAAVIANVGRMFFELNDRKNALSSLENSLSISRAANDTKQISYTLNTLGRIYSNPEEKEIALKNFSEALSITNILENKPQESNIFRRLMTLYRLTGNPRMAVFCGKLSVNNQEILRQKVRGLNNETQKSFLSLKKERYEELADLLLKEGENEQALQVLNLFKDEQFYDFNPEQKESSQQVSLSLREKELAAAYEKLGERIKNLNNQKVDFEHQFWTRQSNEQDKIQLQKLKDELNVLTEAFLDFLKQSERELAKPADEKDKVTDITDAPEMQVTLQNLKEQTGQKAVAVYTLIGEDNFRALIVSPGSIKSVSSPVKGAELNEKILKLWTLFQSDKYDTTVLSKQIYDVVFKPIESELPQDTTLIMWSLNGNLRYIPMSALWDGKQFLAERFNHVIFTRADSKRMTRDLNPNWTGTGFGTAQPQTVELLGSKISFSALPGVTVELREIFKQSNSKRGILTGKIFPDARFTKANFILSLKQKRPVIHIASHFFFRPGDEARSFLLMGDGTAFTLNEMKKETDLFQGVDLLALSACNTAATQQDASGKEIDGFAELAQRLGASSIMATLWQVSDASTPWLMREFYVTKQGITKAEALRNAQLALLNGTAKANQLFKVTKAALKPNIVISTKNGKSKLPKRGNELIEAAVKDAPIFVKDPKKPYSHPYYWSPFILIGNWK